MEFTTADLCDAYPDLVQIAQPVFRDYGGRSKFSGPIETLHVFEDNVLIRQVLESPGAGRVLVVDGEGSSRCALVGGRLAALAQSKGWSGLVINGCVRDATELSRAAIGIRALGTVPRRSGKQGLGKRGETLTFAQVTFVPGYFLYADADGILLAEHNLLT